MYLLYIYSRHHDFRNMQWRVAKFIHEIHFVYVYYLICAQKFIRFVSKQYQPVGYP